MKDVKLDNKALAVLEKIAGSIASNIASMQENTPTTPIEIPEAQEENKQ
jgi:hypothetical protein